MALRRSHFQCGKCEGRRSQSSVARTPSLALPPRWARKEFFVVVCAALLIFVCMLRYSEWNAVPIWSLYSSIFIVVRCADLVPVFFDIYGATLCQSRSCILWHLWCNAGPIWSLYSSIFIAVRWADPVLDSSIFIVVRWADLVSGFFDIYSGMFGRSHFWILRYL